MIFFGFGRPSHRPYRWMTIQASYSRLFQLFDWGNCHFEWLLAALERYDGSSKWITLQSVFSHFIECGADALTNLWFYQIGVQSFTVHGDWIICIVICSFKFKRVAALFLPADIVCFLAYLPSLHKFFVQSSIFTPILWRARSKMHLACLSIRLFLPFWFRCRFDARAISNGGTESKIIECRFWWVWPAQMRLKSLKVIISSRK